MTDTYGDLNDSDLLDNVKGGKNGVFNRIVPILTWRQPQAKGTQGGWQDSSHEAEDFRLRIEQFHRHLQSCVVEGRKGRVSFETVDIGRNGYAEEWDNLSDVLLDQRITLVIAVNPDDTLQSWGAFPWRKAYFSLTYGSSDISSFAHFCDRLKGFRKD